MIEKCIFKSHHCYGDRIRVNYDQPFPYFNWPEVFVCRYHKDCDVNFRDALNSRSNVLTANVKMTHTKELGPLQALDFWMGTIEEIVLCSHCDGTGEIGDSREEGTMVSPCLECRGTGRQKAK